MKKVLILAGLFFCEFVTFGQSDLDKARIDEFVESVMNDWGVPGLALSIVKGDEVLYQKGYGFENLDSKRPVTSETLFSIASSTKSFTATLGALMAERGKLSFNNPLIEYFPDFKLFDEFATSRVTLTDLLTHRTGVPRQKFFSLNTPDTRLGVRVAYKYFEPSAGFRTAFQYCNENYTVAGDMIAELANSKWEELVSKEILEPLEMNSTLFSIHSLDKSMSFATPYIDWEGFPEKMDFHDADILGPAGCIISNVEDLSNWLIFNLNSGKFKGNQIIEERYLSQLYLPRIISNPSQSTPELSHESYGLGWFIDYYKGYRHINHGGVLYGFSSQISFLPDENIGIAVLANLNGTVINRIIERYIYDTLLGLDITDWNKMYLEQRAAYLEYVKSMESKAEESEPEVPQPEVDLKKIIGTYESQGYGSIEVYNRADTLRAKLLGYECSFIPTGKKSFSLYHPVEHQGWPVSIMQKSDGTIESLVIEVNRGLKGIPFLKFL